MAAAFRAALWAQTPASANRFRVCCPFGLIASTQSFRFHKTEANHGVISSSRALHQRIERTGNCAMSGKETGGKFAVVLVMAPNLSIGRKLAKAALKARLVACANLVSKIESHYWWQGRVESGTEVLLVLKTRSAKVAALEKLIVARHPYDTPEFLVLPVKGGNQRYLKWLALAVT